MTLIVLFIRFSYDLLLQITCIPICKTTDSYKHIHEYMEKLTVNYVLHFRTVGELGGTLVSGIKLRGASLKVQRLLNYSRDNWVLNDVLVCNEHSFRVCWRYECLC